ncbi:MAG: hypothetical protein GY910_10135 [bacterium]|nr:hypothetical protein [bacterium]
MSIPFPSNDFFSALQEGLNGDPSCTDHLAPSEAYCGFAVGEQLFVLEFDGHECSAVVPGGNELDLDFVVAGPADAWKKAIQGSEALDASAGLPVLIEKGDLEVRSAGGDGLEMARQSLPFLQVFLDQSRGLDLEFA